MQKKRLCRNHCHNALSAIERVTLSLPSGGGNPRGQVPPLDPQFRSFFRCVFTAILHGARVDRPPAPVAPSPSNAVPYRFFYRAKLSFFYSHKTCDHNDCRNYSQE